MLDRLFIAANVDAGEEPTGGDNPDSSLVRYEFIEVLARIAQEKYQKTGQAESCAQAFEMLIERNLLPVAEAEQWQKFRDDKLHNLEVNDVYVAN